MNDFLRDEAFVKISLADIKVSYLSLYKDRLTFF